MTTAVLNTKNSEVKNKITVVSYLVEETDYDAKFQKSKKSTLLLLITINLPFTYLM